MRILDALSAIRTGTQKPCERRLLETVWAKEKRPGGSGWYRAARDEYPRPQFMRDSWISLDGFWEYAITKDGYKPSQMDGQILVPYSPECRLSTVERTLMPGEFLWYLREIPLDEIPQGKRLILHFGAVDQQCTVWWNGKKLGTHADGYLPFSFDVTRFIRPGKNTLCLRVRDDTQESALARGKQSLAPQGMFYPAQSGIWQTVWMEWVPENRILYLKITPLFDEQKVRIHLETTRPQRVEITISCGEKGAGDTQVVCLLPRDFSPKKESAAAVHDIALGTMRPWSPENPFLYDMDICSEDDQVRSYFAMRKFSAGKDEAGHMRLMLNNRPYFFHGVLDQGYWPESLYTPPSDDAMIYDIRAMKELGFNTLRKHLKIEPLRWYYHCDRLGMVVWQDMVNGGGRISALRLTYLPTIFPFVSRMIRDCDYGWFSRSQKAAREAWAASMEETIALLYNCPCIGLWTLFNEGWGQFDSLLMTRRAKQLDSTRLVDHASGWYDQGGGDVCSIHNYFRRLRVPRDRRPVVISEYGGSSYRVPEHVTRAQSYGYHTCKNEQDFTKKYLTHMQEIRALEKKGLSGAVYTQLSDVEEETNGLLTYDRKVCKVKRWDPEPGNA